MRLGLGRHEMYAAFHGILEFFLRSGRKSVYQIEGLKTGRTKSTMSDFGNILRTSRKLSAARNFLAVMI